MAASPGKSSRNSTGVKRPLSAFMIFCGERRRSVHKKGMSLSDTTKMLSQMWKEMGDTEREPFIEMSTKDKRRYADQMVEMGHSCRSSVAARATRSLHPDGTVRQPHARKQTRRSSSNATPSQNDNTSEWGNTDNPVPPERKIRKCDAAEVIRVNEYQQLHERNDSKYTTPSQPLNSTDSKPSLQNAILPDVGIPVFTEEFLAYNKKLNSNLMKLRQLNKDMIDQKQRLTDTVRLVDNDIQKFNDLIEQQVTLSDSLDMKLQFVRKVVFDFLFELPAEATVNGVDGQPLPTTEDMLDKILSGEKPAISDDHKAKLAGQLCSMLP